MTLKELFDLIGDSPSLVLVYFLMIPLTAAIAGFMGKGEGHLSPWKYLYSTLIYLVCVPGILAVALNIYIFLFEKRSVLDTDIYIQILPLLSMIVTLLFISKNVQLDRIPGFDKMSGLVMMISSTLFLMWIAQKTRIIAFTYLPFQYVILIFIGLMVAFRYGFSQLFRTGDKPKY